MTSARWRRLRKPGTSAGKAGSERMRKRQLLKSTEKAAGGSTGVEAWEVAQGRVQTGD